VKLINHYNPHTCREAFYRLPLELQSKRPNELLVATYFRYLIAIVHTRMSLANRKSFTAPTAMSKHWDTHLGRDLMERVKPYRGIIRSLERETDIGVIITALRGVEIKPEIIVRDAEIDQLLDATFLAGKHEGGRELINRILLLPSYQIESVMSDPATRDNYLAFFTGLIQFMIQAADTQRKVWQLYRELVPDADPTALNRAKALDAVYHLLGWESVTPAMGLTALVEAMGEQVPDAVVDKMDLAGLFLRSIAIPKRCHRYIQQAYRSRLLALADYAT